MKDFILNVTLCGKHHKFIKDLNIHDCIDYFKESQGSFLIEEPKIQRTLKSIPGRATVQECLPGETWCGPTEDHTKLEKQVTFKLRVPFEYDSVGRKKNPFDVAGKYFDEFISTIQPFNRAENLKTLEESYGKKISSTLVIDEKMLKNALHGTGKTYFPAKRLVSGTSQPESWGFIQKDSEVPPR
jgi:hypothetical protein